MGIEVDINGCGDDIVVVLPQWWWGTMKDKDVQEEPQFPFAFSFVVGMV